MNDAALKALVYEDILRLADKHKFNSLEIPKNMMLLNEPFSVENDTLTPTQKLKRNAAKKLHIKDIERMYQEGVKKY